MFYIEAVVRQARSGVGTISMIALALVLSALGGLVPAAVAPTAATPLRPSSANHLKRLPPSMQPIQIPNTPPRPPPSTQLRASTTPAPPHAARGKDLHPEEITALMGKADEYNFVHDRAFVRAPIAKVYAALQNPELYVDRRRVDEWSATKDVDS